MPQMLSFRNSVRTTSGDPLAICQKVYLMQNEIMQSMTFCDKRSWRMASHPRRHPIQSRETLDDHRNLTYFWTAQSLNCHQACWSLYLSCFNFELIHRPGHHSAKPDALSRHVDYKKGEEDNQNQTLLPSTLFHISMTTTGAALIIGREQEFWNRIWNCIDSSWGEVGAALPAEDLIVVQGWQRLGEPDGQLFCSSKNKAQATGKWQHKGIDGTGKWKG